MKQFLTVLGSIFLILIVVGIIGIAFMVNKGSALDKESRVYVDSAIPAIVSDWSEKALLDRASPEFKNAVTIVQLDSLFQRFSVLGRLQRCEPSKGQSITSATIRDGKRIFGKYTTKATFESGDATIAITVVRHGDQWQISRFEVHSPQLAAH